MPVLLGVAAFFLVVGSAPLDPGNIAWLTGADPAQHYLGWAFFRHSPSTFPFGLNPDFGLELSSSVLYSDSLPLFAFLFKPLAPLLPATFQYVGLWLLLCFILQGWFAWRLVGLITEDAAVRLPATAFFLFSPAMLWLLHGHDALFGHWLILAALYLCFAVRLGARTTRWSLLAAVAALVHPYLLAMVLLLWLSDVCRRLVAGEAQLLAAAREACAVAAAVAVCLWQAGFFSMQAGFDGNKGYGYYSLNALALINPGASGFTPKADIWSYLLPPLRHLEGTGDLLFLGTGILALLILAVPPLRKKEWPLRLSPQWLPLLVVLGGSTLFALSHNVALGTVELRLPAPARLVDVAQTLRCSARLFWPVYYVIYLAALYLVIRHYPHKWLVPLLCLLLALQVIDSSRGWFPVREEHAVAASRWTSPFKSPFWEAAAGDYAKLRQIPPGDSPRYADLAFFAASHGMATDAAYLARYDSNRRQVAQEKAQASVASGRYDGDSLYILDRSQIAKALPSLNAKADLLACVDGFYVVAPGWLLRPPLRQQGRSRRRRRELLSPSPVP